jgi:exodeoxyribonuclease VII small subunit
LTKKLDLETKDYTYEDYEKELKRVLNEIENEKIASLDKLIESYEYGSILLSKCEDKLIKAELKLKKITSTTAKENFYEAE